MSEVDAQAKAALEEAGLKYRTDSDGDFKVVMREDGDRSQQVFVGSKRHKVGNSELRSIFSYVHVGDMPDPKIMAYCLEQNGKIAYGSWRLQVDHESQKAALVFGVNLDADADPDELRLMIELAARFGDELEQKLSDEDKF